MDNLTEQFLDLEDDIRDLLETFTESTGIEVREINVIYTGSTYKVEVVEG